MGHAEAPPITNTLLLLSIRSPHSVSQGALVAESAVRLPHTQWVPGSNPTSVVSSFARFNFTILIPYTQLNNGGIQHGRPKRREGRGEAEWGKGITGVGEGAGPIPSFSLVLACDVTQLSTNQKLGLGSRNLYCY